MASLTDFFLNDKLSRKDMREIFGQVMASATANCGGDVTVTCSLPNASCAFSDKSSQDHGGCVCYDGNGNYDMKDCPKPEAYS